MADSTGKLLVVIPSLRGGGAEQVAGTLLNAFPGIVPNLDIVLVLFRADAADDIPKSVRIRSLDIIAGEGLIAVTKRFFQAITRLSAILRNEGPCVILSFMEYTNIVALLANSLVRRVNRIFISVRTRPSAPTIQYASDYRDTLVAYLIRRLYNRADGIVSVSRDAAEDLAQSFSINSNLITVIHNPIDLHHISTRAGEEIMEPLFQTCIPIVLAVGRLSWEKGFDALLKAFALLLTKSSAILVIIGEGPERPALVKLCQELGIEKNVFLLGYQDNPYKYMKRSTMLVLSSRYEGFVNVVAEAMACNLPVLATRCFLDIEEIVRDREAGLLVAVDDIQGLAEGMLTLLDDADLRRRLAAAGASQVQKLAVATIAPRYLSFLGLLPGREKRD